VDNLWTTRPRARSKAVDNSPILYMLLTKAVRSTLSSRAAKAESSNRGLLMGVLCISALIPLDNANAISPIDHYKLYAHSLVIEHKSYKCLEKAWTKESNWNPRAVGNRSGKLQVYGIPQIKNIKLKNMDPYTQIKWGIKYIDHRYNGDPCKLLKHLNKHGWS
jgi:hypothetical protein